MIKLNILKRALHAAGGLLMVSGGFSVAQSYKTVREYCIATISVKDSSSPFISEILRSPETLFPHFLVIAVGFLILSFSDWICLKSGLSPMAHKARGEGSD